MFFKKKSNKCENCNSKIDKRFSFCPYCGYSLVDEEKHLKDYGLIGKGEALSPQNTQIGFGITDKFLGSLMNSLMKNLDKQFKQMNKDVEKTEMRSIPNRISIRIGPAPSMPQKKTSQKNPFKKDISEEQMEKMTSLPRAPAKTKVKRINDKIIYELDAPGISSPHDVFVSKLESGYEIKAISEKKIYVNSLPVNLPIKSISLNQDKLFVEFLAFEQ